MGLGIVRWALSASLFSPDRTAAAAGLEETLLVMHHWRTNDGLSIGLSDRSVQDVVQRYGTPLYLYDLSKLRQQFLAISRVLGKDYAIHYSLKANNSLTISAELARLGCRADVSSEGELLIVSAAGFPPAGTIVTGPGKTPSLIKAALEHGAGLMTVESMTEARRVNLEAQRLGRCQRVLLRVNPARKPAGHGLAIATGITKFGVDEDQAPNVMEQVRSLRNIRCVGIQIFSESNILSADTLARHHVDTVAIAQRLRDRGFPIEIVDFGGGIGVPYRPAERPFDLERYASTTHELAINHDFQFILELGRYLVAESGTYLTRVLDIKQSYGQTIVIVDGGVNHLFRPRLLHANALLEVIGKREPPSQTVSIHGPLPSPEDCLVDRLALPPLDVGDLLAIRNCGAYGLSHGLLGFVSHPMPAEVVVDGDRHRLARERGSPADALMRQRP